METRGLAWSLATPANCNERYTGWPSNSRKGGSRFSTIRSVGKTSCERSKRLLGAFRALAARLARWPSRIQPPRESDFWHAAVSMFLRSTNRKKDGKDHRYFSVVENRRVPDGRSLQRTVLYLGEINDQQQAAWRKTLQVFDEAEQRYTSLSLFPDDRELPSDAVDSVSVKLSGLELRRPRTFGSCWLACELWHQLGLDEFWQQHLPEARRL